MKKLTEYFALEKEIHSYFGYQENWQAFPLEDARDYYWAICDDEVYFSEDKDNINYYSNSILKSRFLPKAIYEGVEFTMIVVDTHTDGNRFLQIFDNSKKVEYDGD